MITDNKPIIYNKQTMVTTEHTKVIKTELEKLGSKIADNVDLTEKHSLAVLLNLACGGGKYSISKESINSIENDEFSIYCTCESSPLRQRND